MGGRQTCCALALSPSPLVDSNWQKGAKDVEGLAIKNQNYSRDSVTSHQINGIKVENKLISGKVDNLVESEIMSTLVNQN